MTNTAETDEREDLLDPEFLRKIEQLSLVSKKIFSGRFRGERRSAKRGSSVEFADYRNYSVGDDFRRVDWNVYARLEKLFLKLFVEEEELNIYVLIDTSRSMDFGDPKKILYARRVAAALSYIALCNFDRVGIAALSADKAAILKPKRGKQSAVALFQHLNAIESTGQTKLAESIRDFSLRTTQPGLAVVISDFFDEEYAKGLDALLSRKFEVILLHLLDVSEVEPPMVGDLALIDSETQSRREITITPSLLRSYKRNLEDFCAGLEEYAARHGCSYLRITNRTPFEDLILSYMRRRGMVK